MREADLSRRILIAGCGYVGTRLGIELAEGGDEVFGLRRDPSSLPDSIAPVACDLVGLAPAQVRARLPERLDACVLAVAASGRSVEAYRAAYVDATRTLVEALGAQGFAGRLVFVSSSGVYGQADGSWVDEESVAEPARPTGAALLEGEAVARERGATILRLAGIYGPGRERLVRDVVDGTARVAPRSAGPSWTNRIHRDDCAGAIAHLLALDEPPALVLGVDDEPADRADVLGWIAERSGRPWPSEDPELAARPNKRLSNARLRATGWNPRFPSWRDGYAPLVDTFG